LVVLKLLIIFGITKETPINSQINGVYEGPDVTEEYCMAKQMDSASNLKILS